MCMKRIKSDLITSGGLEQPELKPLNHTEPCHHQLKWPPELSTAN